MEILLFLSDLAETAVEFLERAIGKSMGAVECEGSQTLTDMKLRGLCCVSINPASSDR